MRTGSVYAYNNENFGPGKACWAEPPMPSHGPVYAHPDRFQTIGSPLNLVDQIADYQLLKKSVRY